MKLKGWVVFFFFVSFLVLEGCSLYEYYEHTISLNEANVYSAYWQPADSLLLEFAADTNNSGKYNFYKYEPRAKELKNKSDGKSVYAISVYSDVDRQTDVFSIGLGLSVVKNGDEYSAYRLPDTLFVDIYGCSDYGCTRAEKIVVHTADYNFTKLLKKGDFEISKPRGNFHTIEFGYDCDVVKDYFFHLKIELDDVKLDLDAQKGSESCYERYNPWCIYC